MYTVGLYTLGCKVSQYETEAIGEGFEKMGLRIMPFEEKCDAYVVNTCTVTAESDRKCRQVIRRAIKKNPDAVVAAIGCYTQRAPNSVAEIPGVDIVIGTENKMSVIPLVIAALSEKTPQYVSTTDVFKADFEPMRIERAPRVRAYVKIEDGCESKCTYCAISAARGRVRSKPRAEVISEVEALSKSGVLEIVLTGIETGSYGRDFSDEYRLADLIAELAERKSARRIRLGSLAPELIGKDFVSKVAGLEILAPHFHLSLQSGSDSVLRAMKRRYTRAGAMENIKRLKEAFPEANFTTDLMVGFPGESEEDFLLTESLVREIGLLDAHVFAYSKREGTPAADFPHQIPDDEKHRRSARLIRVKNEVRDGVLASLVEKKNPLTVIAETFSGGLWSGHADSFVEVRFSSKAADENLQGKEVSVIPVSHKDGVVFCELL